MSDRYQEEREELRRRSFVDLNLTRSWLRFQAWIAAWQRRRAIKRHAKRLPK